MGGGQKDGGAESSEPLGLPRKVLGRFQPVENIVKIKMAESCGDVTAMFLFNNSSDERSLPGAIVLALLRRHALHAREAWGQHAGGWEQRSGQTEASSPAQDQRILGNRPKPQGNRWVSVASISTWPSVHTGNREGELYSWLPVAVCLAL